jgi:hypothetical protein
VPKPVRQRGEQAAFALIRRTEAGVTTFRGVHLVPFAVPGDKRLAEARPRSDERDCPTLVRITGLKRHEIGRAQTPHAMSDRMEVVDDLCVRNADLFRQRTHVDCPGQVRPAALPVEYRAGDREARAIRHVRDFREKGVNDRGQAGKVVAREPPRVAQPCRSSVYLDNRQPRVRSADVARQDSHGGMPWSPRAAA